MTKQPRTKVDTVIALCSRKAGVSMKELAAKLGIGPVACASLLADARRRGAKIKFKKGADGAAGRYFA